MKEFQRIKKIGDYEYKIYLLPSEYADRILKDLITFITPLLGGTIDGMSEDDFQSLMDQKEGRFVTLSKIFTEALGDLDFTRIIQGLLVDSEVRKIGSSDWEELKYNDHFRAKFADKIAVALFCLEENFGDLFTSSVIPASLTEKIKSLKALLS